MNEYDHLSGGSYRLDAEGAVVRAEFTGERPCKCRPEAEASVGVEPPSAAPAPESDPATDSVISPISRRRK